MAENVEALKILREIRNIQERSAREATEDRKQAAEDRKRFDGYHKQAAEDRRQTAEYFERVDERLAQTDRRFEESDRRIDRHFRLWEEDRRDFQATMKHLTSALAALVSVTKESGRRIEVKLDRILHALRILGNGRAGGNNSGKPR